MWFPGVSDSKESTCTVVDLNLIPRLGRSPGEGNGNPLQYSCLENPMDGGVWWPTVHGVTRVDHDWATSPFTFGLQTMVCHSFHDPKVQFMWCGWLKITYLCYCSFGDQSVKSVSMGYKGQDWFLLEALGRTLFQDFSRSFWLCPLACNPFLAVA